VGGAPDAQHQVSWWAELIATSDRFDAAYFVEELAMSLAPEITNPLVRREVELAVATVNRHLLRPNNEEFADDADAGRQRLTATLERVDAEDTDIPEASVLRYAVCAEYPRAAAAAERLLGTTTVLHLVVAALRLERFDNLLAVRLLAAGRPPKDAIDAGMLMGRYQWWPQWLLEISSDRAMEGSLNEGLIAALDLCAYSPLTPAQSHIARKLFSGDTATTAAAVAHLEAIGETNAAEDLRGGDLRAVPLAARLMSM
jgi:hypothetical protein